ncbi:winged helix DNA-binding protein [Parasphingopyxis lamellibrachiae]|uniref:Winged helix DNA-binding protein n=1 Tax=Parasphingopyxis lamellibrachiae TaxID=680125 RepID=A0A3D9FJ32_9SPHN|nr:winged helix DNA-binding protein [Parasphingopyxis lamellibrachiae]RED17723.1 winged helix DNA-binding protein [Parasphingopyxis lamellibrachiae]
MPPGDTDRNHDETEPTAENGNPDSQRTVLRNPNHLCGEGAAFIKTYLRARRDREWQFPRGLFSDPAWDILLDLYAAKSEERKVTIWDACQAASVPKTSGMRWLRILESRHLVEREGDIDDQKNTTVTLTRDAIAGMNRWLDRIHPMPATDQPAG